MVNVDNIANASTTIRSSLANELWSNIGFSPVVTYSLLANSDLVDQTQVNYTILTSTELIPSYGPTLATEPINITNLEDILGPVHDPYPTVILMTIVYIFILITGVTGNLITCLVIARKRYMHTATNYYLFSLAVSDILLLILGLPHDIVLLWRKYPYIFSESFCILRGLTSELSTNASILTITAFTIERYVAICHPLRSHTTLKLSRVIKTIVVIWIIGALCAAPIAYQFGIVYVLDERQQPYIGSDYCAVKNPLFQYIFEITTMVFFVVPICIITVLYILIGIRLRATSKGSSNSSKSQERHIKFNKTANKQMDTNRTHPDSRNNMSMSIKRQNASRRAVIKMLVAVVIAFFFCYSPFHAQRVMAIGMSRNSVTDERFIQIFQILTHISGVTYYLSSTINPILYQIMSKKFQLALRETLPCCQKLHNEHHDLDMAYSTVAAHNPPAAQHSKDKQATNVVYCSNSHSRSNQSHSS